MAISWTWNRTVTHLARVRIGTFPGAAKLVVECRGRGCPGHRMLTAVGRKRIRRLLASLRGRRYRSGDRILIALSARGWLPERAQVTIRDGRLPAVRLLRS